MTMAKAPCRRGPRPPRVSRLSPSSNTAIQSSTIITTPAYPAKTRTSPFPTLFSTVHPPLAFAAPQNPIPNLLAGTVALIKTNSGPVPGSCVANSPLVRAQICCKGKASGDYNYVFRGRRVMVERGRGPVRPLADSSVQRLRWPSEAFVLKIAARGG